MNFFKSIISDDQDNPSESDPDSPREETSNPGDADDGWSFGGFIKSFAAQSESMIETYRKDLQEFGSGLRKETEVLRETASRAVKDLPASLEAAQGAIDVVLKSTASIITREPIGFSSDGDSETPGTNRNPNPGRYSRFRAQLAAIQGDLDTFCEEPEDYGRWKLGFELGDYRDEIDGLIGEDGVLEGVYKRAVPNAVEQETFWCRYFYRVDKLKQQESVRASLVKRAIAIDDDDEEEEEEELSWGVDDDDDDDGVAEVVDGEKGNAAMNDVEEREVVEREAVGNKSETPVLAEEEDLGWDEFEDVGSGDEKKTSAGGGGQSGKRFSGLEDDEDLNWGIEEEDDDDEPVKA